MNSARVVVRAVPGIPPAGEGREIVAGRRTRPWGHGRRLSRLDKNVATPSFFMSGAKRRMAAFLLVACSGAAGCGLANDATGLEEVERRTEVVVEAGEGLAEAVRVDSAVWQPGLFAVGSGDSWEVDGRFRIIFRNLTALELQVRYDLRFLDRDEFLIDLFIPFGQPLVLGAGAAREVEGTFSIRIRDERDIELITTMRIVAKVAKRASGGD